MQDMKVRFTFKGKSRFKQIWSIIKTGRIYTFLTENDILTIWKQYSDYKTKISHTQEDSKDPLSQKE